MFKNLTSKFPQTPKSSVRRDHTLGSRKYGTYLCRGISFAGAACTSLTFGGRLSVVMDSMKDCSEFTFFHRDEKRGRDAELFEFCVCKKGELFSFRSSQCQEEMVSKHEICEFCSDMEKRIALFHEHQLPEKSDVEVVHVPSKVFTSESQRRAAHEARQVVLDKRRLQRAISGEKRPRTELFKVDELTLGRFRCCWDLFLANSKQLTTAKFPHNVVETDGTLLFDLPQIGFGHNTMGGTDFTFSDWSMLTSHLWNASPKVFTDQSERQFLDSKMICILPALALLELSASQREKVHVIKSAFYQNLCADKANLNQRWSSETSKTYFEAYTARSTNSLEMLSYMIEPGAVLHFLIHHNSHFSLYVFSNVSRPSKENSSDTRCRLGIDCLKEHNVEVIADNLAT